MTGRISVERPTEDQLATLRYGDGDGDYMLVFWGEQMLRILRDTDPDLFSEILNTAIGRAIAVTS